MKAESLVVFPRTLKKRTGVKKLRAQDRVPAVIYSKKTEPQNLEIDRKAIEHLYSHAVSEILLVELTIGEGQAKRLAIVQEVQHQPLSGKILHVDLHEVTVNEEIEISVPIEAEGEAEGVKAGGVLDHTLQKVRVRGSVGALPEVIIANVSALNQGDSLQVKDLVVPEGVKVLVDGSITVFSVTAPVEEPVEEAPAAEGEEGAAMAEPEVIREKKATDEEEPADKKKK